MHYTSTEAGARGEGAVAGRVDHLAHHGAPRRPAAVGARLVSLGRRDVSHLLAAGRHKFKNIGSNPRVGLHLNPSAHGGDVVRIEGAAEVVQDVPPAVEVGEYVKKYREGITRIGFGPDGFARTYCLWRSG